MRSRFKAFLESREERGGEEAKEGKEGKKTASQPARQPNKRSHSKKAIPTF